MKTDIPITIQNILKKKLCKYVENNNPDIFVELNDVSLVGDYIENKVKGVGQLLKQLADSNTPDYIIEETCMQELTRDLKPSKYNYIVNILEEDFEFAHQQLQKTGILLYEVINMISCCDPLFESFGYTDESEDNRQLKYAVTGQISEYLSK